MAVKMFEMEENMRDVVDYVNDQEGKFTVIGWYIRGVFSDRLLTSADPNPSNNSSYGNNKTHYYITQIFPTNSAILDSVRLRTKNFDVFSLH